MQIYLFAEQQLIMKIEDFWFMKEYMEQYRGRILLIGFFVFFIHGAKLNSNIIGIDTEDLIQYQSEFYSGWLDTGRQGLVFLKGLLGNLSFHPYFAGALTLLCLICGVACHLMLWDCVWGRKKSSYLSWILCGGLWISHPIMTEQFYFSLQSAEICMGIFLTAAALYLVYRWWDIQESRMSKCVVRGVWMLLVSILLLVLTFSIYQVFVVMYICGAVALILLQSIRRLQENEAVNVRQLMFPILPYLSVFLVAFLLNSLITGCFFQSSDYLSNQIQWGNGNVVENICYIVGHFVKTMTGRGSLYYNLSFGILCVCSVAALFCWLVGRNVKKNVVAIIMFYLVALISTPYLMTIVLGVAPAYRSQLVLPMATGFLAYLVTELLTMSGEYRKEIVRRLWCFVALGGCILGLWQQTQTTYSLYYTDSMRYEHDVALAQDLMIRIEQKRQEEGLEQVALVIIGNHPFVGNNACVEGEMIGVSLFDHDMETSPRYYWSTKRVLGLFHALGADYEIAPQERFENAEKYSWYMDSWPAEDCVKEQEGIIVVKLYDD